MFELEEDSVRRVEGTVVQLVEKIVEGILKAELTVVSKVGSGTRSGFDFGEQQQIFSVVCLTNSLSKN